VTVKEFAVRTAGLRAGGYVPFVFFRSDGRIAIRVRGPDGRREYTPLTAVAREDTGREFVPEDEFPAALALDLDPQAAWNIIHATEGRLVNDPQHYRLMLERALGAREVGHA